MATAKELVDFILEKDLRLKFLDDQLFDLEGEDKHETIKFLGDFEIVDCVERKDRRECIETAVVRFKDHQLYIEEVAVGPCHYSDVMIDGLPNQIEYFKVEPIITTTYGNRNKI